MGKFSTTLKDQISKLIKENGLESVTSGMTDEQKYETLTGIIDVTNFDKIDSDEDAAKYFLYSMPSRKDLDLDELESSDSDEDEEPVITTTEAPKETTTTEEPVETTTTEDSSTNSPVTESIDGSDGEEEKSQVELVSEK